MAEGGDRRAGDPAQTLGCLPRGRVLFTGTGSWPQDVLVAADPRTQSPDNGNTVPARVFVAYATKLGSTGEIAETIAQVLRDGGHRALALPAHDVGSLDDWDAVILGSAVYAAHWQRDTRRFIERFREDLTARPLWLFSGGPLDRRLARADQPITPYAAEITAGLGARAHRTFGGRLAPDAAVDPQVLQTHRIGDFRDWQAIVEYAYRIGRELDRIQFPRVDKAHDMSPRRPDSPLEGSG